MTMESGAVASCPMHNLSSGAAAEPPPGSILGALPGFRHFLGDPTPAERFQVDGADPRQCATALATLRRRLRGLALLMSDRPAMGSAGVAENPRIPSGYTYLLQLMAHDLVASSAAFWAPAPTTPGVANTHGAPLRLRTLYGDGPGACPFAFVPDDIRDQSRSRFRLSAIRGKVGEPDPAKPAFRDIGRAGTPGTLGARGGQGEALIADARNDQNALLAQVTSLFEMLHNAILGMLPPAPSLPVQAARQAVAARFAVAQEATALVFRTILREDLLPRLLDPAVRAAYAGPAPALLDAAADGAIALEFSHGASRFGHAMPRDRYQIGEIADASLAGLIRLTSSRSPNALPLRRDWVLRWSQFFALPGHPAPNASMKLGPRHSAMLVADGLFDPIAAGAPFGIAFRDLMSAGLAGLRSVNDLAAKLRQLRPALAARSPMLLDAALRRRALAEWIGAKPWLSQLGDADVAALAADPPLPFYVLFEAEREADGECLGILGSVLLAETVHGALLRDPLPAEQGKGGLATALDRLCAARLGQWRFPDSPVLHDMPGLVAFVARRLDLQTADPAFL
ncbi:MAG: hypothetical protein JWP04_1825 [Belnapia sp.]|nr:hypothetical protein [Belnapia sp.]